MQQDIRHPMIDEPAHEVALGDVLALVREGWWQILGCFSLLILAGLLYLNFAERRYAARLIVTPIAGSAGLPSGIGGLASIAGIRIPGSDAESQFDLFLEGLVTRESAVRLIRNHSNLLPMMFPGEWNATSRRWEQPHGTIPSAIRTLKPLLGIDNSYRAPDPARVEQWLKREIEIAKARDQRLTVISVVTRDPQFGQQLLSALHSEGDNLLRERAVDRANDYAAYLTEKLGVVTVADYRQALVDALAEQEKTRMMASSDLPFAADPFGPPSTPVRPASPQPLVVLAVSAVLGLLLGVLLVLVRGRRRLFSLLPADA